MASSTDQAHSQASSAGAGQGRRQPGAAVGRKGWRGAIGETGIPAVSAGPALGDQLKSQAMVALHPGAVSALRTRKKGGLREEAALKAQGMC
jgi:hypothetical protein